MKKLLIVSALTLALSACNDDYSPSSAGNSIGSVAVSGNALVGETLSAMITDNNGVESSNVTYTWMADNIAIAGATTSTYVLSDSDVGTTISVSVNYTDNAEYTETAKSSPTDAIEFVPVQSVGAIAISGDVFVDFDLTATITDDNGSGNNDITYSWMADGVVIADATDSTYTLTDDDLDKTITVTALYTDNDDFEEELLSDPTVAVTVKPADVETTKVASITDSMIDDAGELRYKHRSQIKAGKISVSFSKDEVLTADGTAKEAYIALYGTSTSTSNAMIDLRIGNGTYTIRNNSDVVITSTFTPGDWVDVEMTWDATSATAGVAPKVTLTLNGTDVATMPFDSVSDDLTSVMEGVQTVAFKLSDTSSVVTGAYIVDDFKLYSDIAGTTEVFSDDFESYDVAASLDTDNAGLPYSSSTAEAVVAEVIKESSPEQEAPTVPNLQLASITDEMTDDAGELRYKHRSLIKAGKISVSFSKDEVLTADGTTKEAYISLYGTSTSSKAAIIDLRIGNGSYTIRENSDVTVASTFTPGDWINVEMTWDASSASSTVAPIVTLSINGTDVTTAPFDSVSDNLASVMGGVQTVSFRLADTSAVVTGAYRVDDFKLYSDVAGTIVEFSDDFESTRYAVGESLDKDDNPESLYNSSTAEAVVADRL